MYFGANWACRDKDIYYQVSGDSSLWLWYANGVDTTDPDVYMPADAAWPWIKGMAKNGGVDAFYANQDMTGQMVAAKFTNTVHLSDHYLGGTGVDDPETWQEQVSGKFWGINLPGEGIVLHETGDLAVHDVRGAPGQGESIYSSDERFHGNMVYDYDTLCDFFDAGPALTDLPPWVPAP